MKFNKTYIAFVTIISLASILFLKDIVMFAKGKNSLLLGRRKSSILNENSTAKIQSEILALTTRIAKLEESVSKLDADFKKKIVFPLDQTKDSMKNNDSINHEHKSKPSFSFKGSAPLRTKELRIRPSRNNRRIKTDFESESSSLIENINSSDDNDNDIFKHFNRPHVHVNRVQRRIYNPLPLPFRRIFFNNTVSRFPFVQPKVNHSNELPKNLPLNRIEHESFENPIRITLPNARTIVNHNINKFEEPTHFKPEEDQNVKIPIDFKKPSPNETIEVKKFDKFDDFLAYHSSMTKGKPIYGSDGSSTKFLKFSEILNQSLPKENENLHKFDDENMFSKKFNDDINLSKNKNAGFDEMRPGNDFFRFPKTTRKTPTEDEHKFKIEDYNAKKNNENPNFSKDKNAEFEDIRPDSGFFRFPNIKRKFSDENFHKFNNEEIHRKNSDEDLNLSKDKNAEIEEIKHEDGFFRFPSFSKKSISDSFEKNKDEIHKPGLNKSEDKTAFFDIKSSNDKENKILNKSLFDFSDLPNSSSKENHELGSERDLDKSDPVLNKKENTFDERKNELPKFRFDKKFEKDDKLENLEIKRLGNMKSKNFDSELEKKDDKANESKDNNELHNMSLFNFPDSKKESDDLQKPTEQLEV